MKEIVYYTISVKVGKDWRVSPAYASAEQACANIVPFVTVLKQKYTSVTITRNVTVVKEAAE